LIVPIPAGRPPQRMTRNAVLASLLISLSFLILPGCQTKGSGKEIVRKPDESGSSRPGADAKTKNAEKAEDASGGTAEDLVRKIRKRRKSIDKFYLKARITRDRQVGRKRDRATLTIEYSRNNPEHQFNLTIQSRQGHDQVPKTVKLISDGRRFAEVRGGQTARIREMKPEKTMASLDRYRLFHPYDLIGAATRFTENNEWPSIREQNLDWKLTDDQSPVLKAENQRKGRTIQIEVKLRSRKNPVPVQRKTIFHNPAEKEKASITFQIRSFNPEPSFPSDQFRIPE